MYNTYISESWPPNELYVVCAVLKNKEEMVSNNLMYVCVVSSLRMIASREAVKMNTSSAMINANRHT